MSVLVSADWHFSDNPRDSYRHQFQRQLRELVQKEQVEAVLVLGDLTEEKDRHSAALVNAVTEHIYQLSQLCPVVLLRGNHDAIDPTDPFFGFLRRMRRVAWINEPTPADEVPELMGIDIGRSILLPHAADPEKEWGSIDFKQYDWAFAHATFNGAYVGHDQRLEGLPAEKMFPDTLEIISGDIHIPQTLGHVTYVGAPYTVDFGDRYAPRVLFVQGIEVTKSVRVHGPQKKLFEITGLDELDKDGDLNEGDILKVRVQLSLDEHADWPEIQSAIRAWGEGRGYVVHIVQPVLDKTKRLTKEQRTVVKQAMRDHDLIREYSKRVSTDKVTLKAGIRLAGDSQ